MNRKQEPPDQTDQETAEKMKILERINISHKMFVAVMKRKRHINEFIVRFTNPTVLVQEEAGEAHNLLLSK